ncbi:MAG: hypothetical protein NC301_03225 [Bacteroides sp.]|nr:hypothetical protein [Bacteroides sp.]MCM1379005.1 hypothetical protein [Bacteroides sp.]MCM1445621.1 hypothetical protein [Prevotella sp.]
MPSLITWLKMMRVGRGFTVHSPFAYHFIRSCLKERLPYYAFRRDVTTKAGQRLFRVAAYINPAAVCFIGEATEARRIVALACPRAREVSADNADLTYVAAGSRQPDDFKALYVEKPLEAPDDAMIFTNRNTMVAIRRPGLPSQTYLLKF